MLWCGMVWYGMVWYGMVWSDITLWSKMRAHVFATIALSLSLSLSLSAPLSPPLFLSLPLLTRRRNFSWRRSLGDLYPTSVSPVLAPCHDLMCGVLAECGLSNGRCFAMVYLCCGLRLGLSGRVLIGTLKSAVFLNRFWSVPCFWTSVLKMLYV